MRVLLAVLLFSGQLFAQESPVNVFTADYGEWEVPENWSLFQPPASGEIVIIPSTSTVMISKSINLAIIDLTVAGHLILQDARLEITEKGRLILAEKAGIHGTNNSEEEQLIIGKQIKFVASAEKEIIGFAIADENTGESPKGFTTKNYRTPNIFYGNKKNELWNDAEQWSLGRLPGEGDAVMVPAKIRAIIDEEQNLEDVSITITGELILRKAGLFLGKPSTLTVDKEGILSSENLSESENVLIGGVIKFDGQKEEKINGFGVANSLSGISPKGFSQNAILPIILQSFSGRTKEDNIFLEWTTGGDETARRFDIQTQNTTGKWQTIGSLNTGEHPFTGTTYYFQFKQTERAATYCRLAIINQDNHYEYSRIIAVGNQNIKSPLEIYTGSTGNIQVNFPATATGNTMLKIADVQGRILKIMQAMPGQTSINIQLAQRGLLVLQLISPEFKTSRLWYNR